MKAIPSVVPALFVLSMLAAGQSSAASACKGLSESACSAKPDCGWTQSYTRKDGRQVGAYCRIKPQGKETAQAAVAKPKS